MQNHYKLKIETEEYTKPLEYITEFMLNPPPKWTNKKRAYNLGAYRLSGKVYELAQSPAGIKSCVDKIYSLLKTEKLCTKLG